MSSEAQRAARAQYHRNMQRLREERKRLETDPEVAAEGLAKARAALRQRAERR